MPSSIIRNPAGPDDDDFKAQQKVELDRLRTAIGIVERMRQAGITAENLESFGSGWVPAQFCKSVSAILGR